VALPKFLMLELLFHFSGFCNSVERGLSMYVVGSISSIMTKPRLRTSLPTVIYFFQTKESLILATVY
jgi:hypothetical protein